MILVRLRVLPWRKLALWAIVLLGFALRVYHLGTRPLWDDEAFTALNSVGTPWAIALQTAKDTFPPLYGWAHGASRWILGDSEFAVRFASLLAGVLAIPLAQALGRHLVSRDVGLFVALLIAVSSYHVYFAQEARAYTWLVFNSMLAVYAFIKLIQLLERDLRPRIQDELWLAGANALTIYTHYLGVWILIIEGLYFVGWWLIRRRSFRSYILSQLAVIVFLAPWLLVLLTERVRSNAGVREFAGIRTSGPLASLLWILQEGHRTHKAISLPRTLWQTFVSFNLGDSLPGSMATWFALGFALLSLIGLIGLATRTILGRFAKFPGSTYFLLLYAGLPVCLSYVVSFPLSRPHWTKYFIIALPAFLLLSSTGALALGKQAKGLAALALAFMVGVNGFGVYNYFESPQYARPDPRPAIRYLEAFSTPGDALLCNPPLISPQFWHYYKGKLTYYSPAEWTLNEPFLQELSRKHVGLWVVQNLPVDFDPNQSVERWLTYHAYRTFTDWVGNLVFRYYSMPSTMPPALDIKLPQSIHFGNRLALQSYRVALQTGGRVPILQLELQWKALVNPESDYLVAVRAVGSDGQTWGQTNSAPLGNFRPTSGWQAGEEITDHLGLMLYPGTPPGDYRLELWVYRDIDGAWLPTTGTDTANNFVNLGTVIVPAPAFTPLPDMLALDARLDQSLDDHVKLVGAQLEGTLTSPGKPFTTILFWEMKDAAPEQTLSIWLEDSLGHQFALQTGPLGGGQSSSPWPTGQMIRDPHKLHLPKDIPDGSYVLKIQVDRPNGASFRAALGKLQIKGRAKQFQPPRITHPQIARFGNTIELLGYDLSSDSVAPGGELNLILYWHALSPVEVSYTVFNHLLGEDGTLVGQWDGIPVQGTVPTTDWVSGEIIADRYRIPVKADARPGIYRLWVGLYEASTGHRLTVEGTAADSVELQTPITISQASKPK